MYFATWRKLEPVLFTGKMLMSRLAQRREIYGRESVFITFTVTLTTVSMILNLDLGKSN